ncbi:hypothetical protein MASR2M78_25650 [Treponema sp.]
MDSRGLWARCETDGRGYEVVFATEESYGYLVESEVRDKDGISAAALTAEMTIYWHDAAKARASLTAWMSCMPSTATGRR